MGTHVYAKEFRCYPRDNSHGWCLNRDGCEVWMREVKSGLERQIAGFEAVETQRKVAFL